MLAALLCQPFDVPSGADYEPTRRRRPGERFTTREELIRAHEELTKFKALPDMGQQIVAATAIREIEAAESDAPEVLDAKEALEQYQSATDALRHLEELNILLLGYFVLKFERKSQEDDVAAMLMLGIL